MEYARAPLAHLTTYTNNNHSSNYGMKPVMLPSSLRINEASSGGGAVAGHASPPALSPNLPSIVKVEPRLPSPCLNSNLDQNVNHSGNVMSNGNAYSPSKRIRQEDGTWIPSPSQMSMGSISPPPMVNGHSMMVNNGLSPASMVSSYDPYSPKGKEDMSPPSSGMNGCYGVDSYEAKKKKGPTPRQQEELCLVCGDRASGYHYNALTCEGCKGFFRRSITKNAVYQCKYGNNCEIDMYMRRKCQECRLKKCLGVGMRPECVVPEYQCAIKRESKRVQKEKDRPNSTTKDSPCLEIKEEKPSELNPLRTDQEDVINKLVFFQQEFESPSEEDFKKITAFPLGDTEEDSLKRFQHITEITILTVQLIVEFSKRVPGFDTLLREDQITLLKACSSEVMMLRTARKYDIKTDSIVFANNQPYTRENYRSASMGESADAIFHFCRKMCLMKVDNAEYALLTAIVIFSERPSLIETKRIENLQMHYVETLRKRINLTIKQRLLPKTHFAHLMSVLTDLHSLADMNYKQCQTLDQRYSLPPILVEMWDIRKKDP